MTLQESFIASFQDVQYITTKDIYEWYSTAKRGGSLHTYRSAIYALIIVPLMQKGLLIKLSKGLYTLDQSATRVEATSNDEWETYIKSKLEGKDQ